MPASTRRYDIDWVRVIAIGLLLLYHAAIAFQPWGMMIGFITSSKSWESLWIPMTMLNVWRIPLLFFVSGMGVYFALQSRNWKQLVRERASRILFPFLFGAFFIVPVHIYMLQYYYQFELIYSPHPGHLWFLANIFIYVLLLLPVFFYLKKNEKGRPVRWIRKGLGHPLGLLPVIGAFVAEALLVDPVPFERYALTGHGFFLGLLAFFSGFCFVLSGPAFWKMIVKWRYLFLVVAAVLFALRLLYFIPYAPHCLLSVESNCWIISVFAFGHKYGNRPNKALRYLSQAAYPVYMVHMVFLSLGSLLLFPLEIAAPLQFVLLLLFMVVGCFTFYELVIRRVRFIRPLFGLRRHKR